MDQNTLIAVLTGGALVAAVIAAIFSALLYRQKSGIHLRGGFTTTSSISSEDRYVSSVTLENQKDRAAIVFKILLELSNGYWLEIEEFEKEPLIIGPFETVVRSYEPIDLYSVNMRRISIDDLLDDRKVRNRLVLSTSHGKYVVDNRGERWDPIYTFFKNYTTAVIQPLRSTFDGKSFGSGTKFILKLMLDDQDDEVIPIYPGDFRGKKFKRFRLSEESLRSREALEEYLVKIVHDGKLECTNFVVYDLEEWRKEVYSGHTKELGNARPRRWFVYNVLGRIVTWWDKIQMKLKNRAAAKQRRSADKRKP